MLDFLFAAGQFLCVLGLLYGLLLVLSHGDCVDEMRPHYDPVAGHEWLTLRGSESPQPARSRQTENQSEDATRIPQLS